MRLLEGQLIAGAPGSDAPGGVRFAVQFDGQPTHLRPGKTTIGSSPRCNLRIQQPGVHPLHCLIVQEGGELTVRRWAGDALLNGVPFDEAPLTAGDRLCLGSADVTVVDLDGEAATWGEAEQPAVECKHIDTGEPVESRWAGEPMPVAGAVDAAPTPSDLASKPVVIVASADTAEVKGELQALRQQVSDVEQKVTQWDQERMHWLEALNGWTERLEGWEEKQTQWQQQIDRCENQTADYLRRADALEQQVTTLSTSYRDSTPTISGAPAARFAAQPVEEQTPTASWGERFEESTPNPAGERHSGTPKPLDAFADERPQPAVPPTAFDWSTLWKASAAEVPQPEHPSDAFRANALNESEASQPQWGNPLEPSSATLVDQPAEEAGDGWRPSLPADVATSEYSSVEPQAGATAEMPAYSPRKAGPESFIERYSPMFAEDGGQARETPAPASPPSVVEQPRPQKPRSMGVVQRDANSPALADENEESIEQYMAKLLQRVRGDGTHAPASQAPPLPALWNTGQTGDNAAKSWSAFGPESEAPLGVLSASEGKLPWVGNFAPGKRKQAHTAPATDLEALRALANETARRAITTHALRKYRRNAVTKMIVSTLAGVTSLWLMLQSPHWRDLQFITACVSLMIAAYWAGETYRTLVESLRARGYDGPEDDGDQALVGFQSPLPIDLDRSRI
ncbi:MAG: FHA domain-containing protein [Pirellulales bacterium]